MYAPKGKFKDIQYLMRYEEKFRNPNYYDIKIAKDITVCDDPYSAWEPGIYQIGNYVVNEEEFEVFENGMFNDNRKYDADEFDDSFSCYSDENEVIYVGDINDQETLEDMQEAEEECHHCRTREVQGPNELLFETKNQAVLRGTDGLMYQAGKCNGLFTNTCKKCEDLRMFTSSMTIVGNSPQLTMKKQISSFGDAVKFGDDNDISKAWEINHHNIKKESGFPFTDNVDSGFSKQMLFFRKKRVKKRSSEITSKLLSLKDKKDLTAKEVKLQH